MQDAIFQAITKQQSQLMKPIEDQALYRLGRMEQENTFLRAKVETLLQEIEQYKALPLPVDQVKEKLQEQEKQIQNMEDSHRRELQQVKIQAEEEKEKTLTVLQAQITDLQQEKEAFKIQAEKEKAEAEEREKQMADAWRKELEEARRPWYRKLFS